jgi:hypothetical protein
MEVLCRWLNAIGITVATLALAWVIAKFVSRLGACSNLPNKEENNKEIHS